MLLIHCRPGSHGRRVLISLGGLAIVGSNAAVSSVGRGATSVRPCWRPHNNKTQRDIR